MIPFMVYSLVLPTLFYFSIVNFFDLFVVSYQHNLSCHTTKKKDKELSLLRNKLFPFLLYSFFSFVFKNLTSLVDIIYDYNGKYNK